MKFNQGPKNGHFLKGLVHGFCPKIELSLIGVFFSCYCGKKRMILRGKNSSFKKGKKLTFLKGVSPWFLSENRTLSYCSFSQKLCPKRSFFDILRRKHSFLDQKIEVLPSAKKWTFFEGPKKRDFGGASPWILSKNLTFSDRCFSQKLC